MTLRDFMGWTPENDDEARRGWTDQERAFYIASAVVRAEEAEKRRNKAKAEAGKRR